MSDYEEIIAYKEKKGGPFVKDGTSVLHHHRSKQVRLQCKQQRNEPIWATHQSLQPHLCLDYSVFQKPRSFHYFWQAFALK